MVVLRVKIDLLKRKVFSFKMKVYVDAQNMCLIHLLFTNMSHRHQTQSI